MPQSIFKTDLQYFGSIHFVKTLMENRNVVFDLDAPFTKMSFKNRMVIVTSQGPLMLTIPIVGGRDQKTPIKDITIAYDSPWSAQHLKSIITSYKRAPYFEYYVDSLKALYDNDYIYLNDFLIATQQWTKQQLKAKWEIYAVAPRAKGTSVALGAMATGGGGHSSRRATRSRGSRVPHLPHSRCCRARA